MGGGQTRVRVVRESCVKEHSSHCGTWNQSTRGSNSLSSGCQQLRAQPALRLLPSGDLHSYFLLLDTFIPPLPGHLPSSPNISRCRLIVSFAITGVVIEDSIIMSPLLTPHWFEHDGWSLAELYFLWHHSIKPQLQMRAAESSSRTHQLAVPCCGKALSPVD